MSTSFSVTSVKEEPDVFEKSKNDTYIHDREDAVFIKTEVDFKEESKDSAEDQGLLVNKEGNEVFIKTEDHEEGSRGSGDDDVIRASGNHERNSRHPDNEDQSHSDLLCPKCGRCFIRQKPFLKHKAACSGGFGFPCERCPHKAKSFTCLKNHIIKQHQGDEEALFSLKSNLNELRKTKEPRKLTSCHCNVTCKFCKKTYKSIKYLKRHMKRQCLYTCQYCDFSCTQRKSFRIHSLAVHSLDIIPTPNNKFKCSLCGKTFINTFSIEQHCKDGCFPLSRNNDLFKVYKNELDSQTKQLILQRALEITNKGVSEPHNEIPLEMPVPIDNIKVEPNDEIDSTLQCGPNTQTPKDASWSSLSGMELPVPLHHVKVECKDEPEEYMTSAYGEYGEPEFVRAATPIDLPVPVTEIKVETDSVTSNCGVSSQASYPSVQNESFDAVTSPSDSWWKDLQWKWGVEDKTKWKGVVTCTMCPMKFHNRRALSLHMSIRHGPKLRGSHYKGPWFICPNCPSKYQSKKSLSIHLKFECNIEPEYECHYCGRRFHRKIKLSYHIERNSCRREQFQCPNLCGGFFTQAYSFLRHLRTVCTRSATFTCTHCSKVFFRKDNLSAHLKRHRLPPLPTP